MDCGGVSMRRAPGSASAMEMRVGRVLCVLATALVLSGCGKTAPASSVSAAPPYTVGSFPDVNTQLARTPAPTPAATPSAASPSAAPTAEPSSYCQFGATTAAWDSCHQVDSKYVNESGYLPFSPSPGGGEDQFAGVSHNGGRVVGWLEAFPEGTPLAIAEHTMETQLPPDAQQTANFRAHSSDGTSACVLINYQSATLAQWIGGGAWGDTDGAIGVSLYQVNADGSGSEDTDEVNTANVDIAPAPASATC